MPRSPDQESSDNGLACWGDRVEDAPRAHRVSPSQVKRASALLPYLAPGALLESPALGSLPPVFAHFWLRAQADSFDPLD
jgi:hypothetical protein